MSKTILGVDKWRLTTGRGEIIAASDEVGTVIADRGLALDVLDDLARKLGFLVIPESYEIKLKEQKK